MSRDLIYSYEILLTDIEDILNDNSLDNKEKQDQIDKLLDASELWRGSPWN